MLPVAGCARWDGALSSVSPKRDLKLASPNGGFTPRFAQKFPPDTAYSAPPGSPTARPPQSPGEAPPVPSARGNKGCSRSPVQVAPPPAPQIDSLKAARRQEPEC